MTILLSPQFWGGLGIGFVLGVFLMGVLTLASKAGDAMDSFYKDKTP